MKQLFLLSTLILVFYSCNAGNKSNSAKVEPTTRSAAPVFNADSAYSYVEAQSKFGPRVPNTAAHIACGDYLTAQLKKFGATVVEQHTTLNRYDGVAMKIRNIIGSYQPEKENRVLLLSHWDSRPFADNDPDKKNHHTPVLGVNDGASGVGVLLELARLIGEKHPNIGVDILFVDAEDVGAPYFYKGQSSEEDWCLGTQYWAKNPHKLGYKAKYGILLDMVGAGDAVFYKDYYSMQYASGVAEKVWVKGQSLGFGQYFRTGEGGAVTDDHLFVNRLANIPCIDIIHYDPQSQQGFPAHWHTIDDTMKNIQKPTLKAVGQTLVEVLFEE